MDLVSCCLFIPQRLVTADADIRSLFATSSTNTLLTTPHFVAMHLLLGGALADFPQLFTVLQYRDSSGLSLSAISMRLFTLVVVASMLSLEEDGGAPSFLIACAATMLVENILLLGSISLFSPREGRWPKFSAAMIIAAAMSFGIITFRDEEKSVRPILEFVRFIVQLVAGACCLLSPLPQLYFNYKHKITRNFSKTSQLMLAVAAAAGVTLQVTAANGSPQVWHALVAVWHCFLHFCLFVQVLKSDRGPRLEK